MEGSSAVWLGAPNFVVLDVVDDGVELVISIESTLAFVGCSTCGTRARPQLIFKVSYGSGDKSLIELKLASNSALKRNREKQVAIYAEANQTWSTVKVIISYTAQDQARVATILEELKLDTEKSVVVIDARHDNKPSASKA